MAETPPSAQPRLAGKRILVVEDDAEIRRMLAVVLTTAAADVEVAAGATAALRRLDETALPFDALVLDWNLQDLAGIDLLRRLEADHAAVYARCLVITGDLVRSNEKHEAVRHGRPVLGKPFRPRQLIDALVALTA